MSQRCGTHSFVYSRASWLETWPIQKLLVRVKFTCNPYWYRTCINVNGCCGKFGWLNKREVALWSWCEDSEVIILCDRSFECREFRCNRVCALAGHPSRDVGRHFVRYRSILRLRHRSGWAFQSQTLQRDRRVISLLTYLLVIRIEFLLFCSCGDWLVIFNKDYKLSFNFCAKKDLKNAQTDNGLIAGQLGFIAAPTST